MGNMKSGICDIILERSGATRHNASALSKLNVYGQRCKGYNTTILDLDGQNDRYYSDSYLQLFIQTRIRRS